MTLPIERNELEKYVPHRGKMLLLSRVTQYDIEKFTVTAEADITESFVFYEDELDGIPDWCTFEIMAQSVSALTGINDRARGLEPKAGCILSVTGFESSQPVFRKGTTVKVCAEEEYRDDNGGFFRYCCRAYASPENSEPVAKAVITVMQVENLSDVLSLR